ncbi:hypothetical protein AOQ84DRAFT_357252 [Glonium stellatum]|uniref:Uncharacterized protein n=1 Tax=Glonium stellatum TaxID=574774 RepID=A0A8E2EPV6_9PEZI|nr:hypothetical protein AOQ84DRAFT_357252 [Glonium stellatum]
MHTRTHCTADNHRHHAPQTHTTHTHTTETLRIDTHGQKRTNSPLTPAHAQSVGAQIPLRNPPSALRRTTQRLVSSSS